jgi:hypothetical protein
MVSLRFLVFSQPSKKTGESGFYTISGPLSVAGGQSQDVKLHFLPKMGWGKEQKACQLWRGFRIGGRPSAWSVSF